MSCDDGSLSIYYKETKKYEINLPTGATVSVMFGYKWELNVDIQATAFDTGNVEGLCGNLDGNKRNNFIVNGIDMSHGTQCGFGSIHRLCRNRFILYYRVAENQVLFPITDTNRHYVSNLQGLNKSTEFYCVCPFDDGLYHHSAFAGSECSIKRHQLCNYRNNSVRCSKYIV